MRERRRRCEFCRCRFVPDPRVAGRQRACRRDECRAARRKKSQSEWLARHPDAFRGRYPKLCQWLDAHPGYLHAYRTAHPEHRAARRESERRRRARKDKARVDIQDTIQLQLRVAAHLEGRDRRVDMQDEMTPQLVLSLGVAHSNPAVDRQDAIAHPIAYAYARGLELWQWAIQERRKRRAHS